jgi:DNA helicase-2/ATP-dependent DNA helicase PcrA
MEENTFPSYMAISAGDDEELEEERRLCYVGITRARKDLTMTAVQMRMVRGEPQFLRASRFVREIPRELVELERETTDTRNFLKPPTTSLDKLMGYGRGEGGSSYSGQGGFGESSGFGRRGTRGESTAKTFSGSGFSSGSGSYGMGSKSSYHLPGKPPAARFDRYKVEKLSSLDYGQGDQVRHVKFGVGTVTEVKKGARDFEVTVDFENYGIKRMFASFAKLKKI